MKTTKILYWVFTGLIVALMLFSAISSFIPNPQGDEIAKHMGYPLYIFKFLAVAKILGVVALLIPGYSRLKEWAYAGFFFAMSGAVFSHFALQDGAKEFFGPLLLIILTVVSWYYRPADRKLVSFNS